MKTFEQYLQQEIWKPVGVLDDDMEVAFDAWLETKDVNIMMDLADLYGRFQFLAGKEYMLQELRPKTWLE